MVIADTGFWLALANRADRYHDVAKTRLSELQEPLVTTWPVMAETCYLLLTRLGNDPQERFIRSYAQGAFEVFELTRDHALDIARYMRKYADLPMDLADATLVRVAEREGLHTILTINHDDFETYRIGKKTRFRIVPPR